MGDWLGTGTVAPRYRSYRPFVEARAFVRALGLKSRAEWAAYCRSGNKPDDIPFKANRTYRTQWRGVGDWLGTGTVAPQNRSYRPFVEARAFVRALGLKNRDGWHTYCRSGKKPDDIAAAPERVYRAEWRGMGDWLGTGTVANQNRLYRSFVEARAFVQALELKNEEEWRAYCRTGKKPDDIPSHASRTYRTQWRGMGDWLGTGTVHPRNRSYRPFVEARAFVHALELKNVGGWNAYCRTGKKPDDIPFKANRTYRTEWRGWGDWLGTGAVHPKNRSHRPFAEARTFVQALGLKSQADWVTYCQSGKKPDDIAAAPWQVYRAEWRGVGDWLGTGAVAFKNRSHRPFAEARTFVQALGLKSQADWVAYCQSGKKPEDIAVAPGQVYRTQWCGWGDWLGTGRFNRNRSSRSFAEARAFVHALGLKNVGGWNAYCRTGKKPDDIPATPQPVYLAEWRGWGDWLGTGTVGPRNRLHRPFVEARTFVRALGLKSAADWVAYCQSGKKPDDIAAAPEHVYRAEWRGLGDWLGIINSWTRAALLAFLSDLRPLLPTLDERELYVVLQQGGALPAFRAALDAAPPLAVIRDLKDAAGAQIEQALRQTTDEEIEANAAAIEASGDLPNEATTPVAAISTLVDSGQSAGETLPSLASLAQSLGNLDTFAALHYGLDDEAAEFLVTYRVGELWQRYLDDPASVRTLLEGGGSGPWFTKIKTQFLLEADGAEHLAIPAGWSFAVDGVPRQPNLMQRRIAWAVRERGRVGNWSGVGSGKTLSAVLASRVIDARITLIVTNNATAEQWAEQIQLAYPNSVVHRHVSNEMSLEPRRHHYVVLNYEKFQVASGGALVRRLLALDLDFVVLDEVQFVKQRDERVSQRRKALEALIVHAAERKPSLRVLGMSATPVINNLLEARKLLEITVGADFSDLGTRPTINNALAVHQKLMLHGFRYRPPYEQEMRLMELPVTRNDLLDSLRSLERQVLPIEQLLLPAKLDAIKDHLQRGTLVYTHYVEGMLPHTRRFVERRGFRAGVYTGTDKSGLTGFLNGQVDVLVASSPVGTGLDGLQKVCHRLIMLCLPWTNAEYEQIIGRIRRQGGAFGEVEIVVPQVLLDYEGDTWSWDRRRLAVIHYKRTLSDCALDGEIPETVRLSPNALLQQGRAALDSWIARVAEHGLLMIDRERLTVPLPDELRHAAVRAHGEFTELNRRWSVSRSTSTHQRVQLDPSEWYLYHTLYREARNRWTEIPAQHIAERIRPRPEWVVGDFGCGECLLAQALPGQRIIGLDHVAISTEVTACDMVATPLAAQSLDCAVFSLSLMGTNWADYLKEAHRTLKPYGYLFVAEPSAKWRDRRGELQAAVEELGFQMVGDVEQRYDFLYLIALKV